MWPDCAKRLHGTGRDVSDSAKQIIACTAYAEVRESFMSATLLKIGKINDVGNLPCR
jgi:hypothetical protein